MPTMTTTAHRGTPVASIAPTQNQNTAPVFEFECLFTHDLRKKKKTWHDGSLRFHTFNRRIMVYDDSKNFIGDLHYREANELQGGEELRLDKGVLVDVGRRTGQTETDLSEVVDKGRHGDEAAQTRQVAPVSMHQRVPPASLQGRPKSLAAVLGTSQGPIGRAKVSIKSPYEQRQALRPDSVFEQPPAKRQRIATGKENLPGGLEEGRTEQRDGTRPLPSASPALRTGLLASRSEHNGGKTIIDISSDEEEPASPTFSSAFRSSAARPKGTKAMRNPPAKLDLAPKPPKPKQKPPPRLLSVIEPASVTSNVQEKRRATTKPNPAKKPVAAISTSQKKRKASAEPPARQKDVEGPSAASGPNRRASSAATRDNISPPASAQGKQKPTIAPAVSTNSKYTYSGPTSSLRFAPQKPRPKLVYKALLPASFVTSRQGTSKSANTAPSQPGSLAGLTPSPARPTPQILAFNTPVEGEVYNISSLASNLAQYQREVTPSNSHLEQTQISTVHQDSSPLFCTQSPQNGISNVVVVDVDDSPVPSPMKTPLPESGSLPESPIADILVESSPISEFEAVLQVRPPPISKLTMMDQRLMMPPPARVELLPKAMERPAEANQEQPQGQISPSHMPTAAPSCRPFRRVLSENDSPARNTSPLTTNLPPAAIIPSALAGMRTRNMTAKPVEPRNPFKSPSKLQRSYSDTAAMLQLEKHRPIGRLSVNVPEIVDETAGDDDSGPWSTREAFLLFDWWPPGREKPDYGDSSGGGGVCEQQHQEPVQRSFAGFTHPRNAVGFGMLQGVIRDGVDI